MARNRYRLLANAVSGTFKHRVNVRQCWRDALDARKVIRAACHPCKMIYRWTTSHDLVKMRCVRCNCHLVPVVSHEFGNALAHDYVRFTIEWKDYGVRETSLDHIDRGEILKINHEYSFLLP